MRRQLDNGSWVPNDLAKGNLRERVRASVIPVNVEMGSGEVRHVMMTLKGPHEDPLVNKFPGDWESTVALHAFNNDPTLGCCGVHESYPGHSTSRARLPILIPIGCRRPTQALYVD